MSDPTPDHYELLGVSRSATAKDIKKAYRAQVAQYHPDKHEGDKTSIYLFQLIQKAYESLKETKIVLPMMQSKKKQSPPKPEPVVPGTNISENDMRVLGEKLKDPWFHPSFNLTEFFGDVAIPEENTQSSKSNTIRPRSSRT